MSDDAAAMWSVAADDWSTSWGGSSAPVWARLLAGSGLRPGARVLDVGCGGGQLLAHLLGAGYEAAGVDPAPRMVQLARQHAPGADVRAGGFEALPFPDGAFDAVVAVNSLQFADDHVAALREAARVLAPGGSIGVASWAEAARNDVDAVEDALADAHDEQRHADPDYRVAGGLEAWIAAAGLAVAEAGLVDVPWEVPDDDHLVRGILLGEDEATIAELSPIVRDASASFRTAAGGYRFDNAFRYAIARPAAIG